MARSSYAENRSRSAVIFWSNVFFVLGVGLSSALVGAVGPLIMNEPGTPIAFDEHVLWAAGAVLSLLLLFLGKLWLMGSDGNRIAKSMGATLIDPTEGIPDIFEDPRHNRKLEDFVHYIETCALSAGLSDIPSAYVVFNEVGMNAFAAGSGAGKAVVAITEGALLAFDNEELEGVVGHEVAHIVQGDTKFATKMIALCTALMIATEIGWFLMRIRSGKENRLAVIGIVVGLTGILGTVCARLMQAFLSRQAEFRADASGSLYAGSTRGLISALRKIDATQEGNIATKIPPAYAHMLLAPPGQVMSFKDRLVSLSFATHPPTRDRIVTLEGSSYSATDDRVLEKSSPFQP